ncbi:MAG TPA: alpha/beta hydrolase [Terriglobales bacterium]|nr:alpha/beta hydrolase [Terriglobales bacterium]
MSQDILEIRPPKPDQRVRYGDDPFQFADIRRPKRGGPSQAVMMIHGGFWRAKYDLEHTGVFCAALTDAGFTTVNLEYRRVGNPGGGWPGTVEDIQSAYKFFRQDAKEWGFKKIVVMGHSAGGHLALCLAAKEPTLDGAISLAGVLDLQKAYDLHLSNDAVVEFMGGTPAQSADRYREASPFDLRITVPQVVITGSADEVVPPEFSRRYVAEKRSKGEKVELVEIAEADHMAMVDPRTKAFPEILKAVKSLTA